MNMYAVISLTLSCLSVRKWFSQMMSVGSVAVSTLKSWPKNFVRVCVRPVLLAFLFYFNFSSFS